MAAQLHPLIAKFEPIDLAGLANVALLDRMETKYVLGISQLCSALQSLTDRYRVLDINGMRLNHYQTVYFDTHDFVLYQQHHNGLSSRYKVRARKYVDSHLAFLEVKHKTNRDRTVKSRLSIPDILTEIPFEFDHFIDSNTPFDAGTVEPRLWNDYIRLTLVSTTHEERLTLDLDVTFHWNGESSAMPGIVIAEVKQDHRSSQSDFIQQMRRLGVRPAGFGQIRRGVYSRHSGVKINNFKPQICHVQKLIREELGHGLHH
ncbi:MAG: polyphosphate polymerase domain-containing protein [Chloroflexi bacterium]|nr:polyphosphate polymerase domain-containing protein [Chloroflexota bacterium]